MGAASPAAKTCPAVAPVGSIPRVNPATASHIVGESINLCPYSLTASKSGDLGSYPSTILPSPQLEHSLLCLLSPAAHSVPSLAEKATLTAHLSDSFLAALKPKSVKALLPPISY